MGKSRRWVGKGKMHGPHITWIRCNHFQPGASLRVSKFPAVLCPATRQQSASDGGVDIWLDDITTLTRIAIPFHTPSWPAPRDRPRKGRRRSRASSHPKQHSMGRKPPHQPLEVMKAMPSRLRRPRRTPENDRCRKTRTAMETRSPVGQRSVPSPVPMAMVPTRYPRSPQRHRFHVPPSPKAPEYPPGPSGTLMMPAAHAQGRTRPGPTKTMRTQQRDGKRRSSTGSS